MTNTTYNNMWYWYDISGHHHVDVYQTIAIANIYNLRYTTDKHNDNDNNDDNRNIDNDGNEIMINKMEGGGHCLFLKSDGREMYENFTWSNKKIFGYQIRSKL